MIFPADVDKLKADVKDRVTDLGDAVARCTKVDDPDYEPMQASWHTLQGRVVEWLDSEPGLTSTSAKQFQTGETLIAEMQAFSARLVRMGCAQPPKASAPKSVEPEASLDVEKVEKKVTDTLTGAAEGIALLVVLYLLMQHAGERARA